MTTAAKRWARDLGAWAIPDAILAAAPESPWGFPKALYARRADQAEARPSPSIALARAVLPDGGTVLDVGCGAGAASLPLAGRAATLVGVDSSSELLAAFAERAQARGVAVRTIAGTWPDVAGATPVADVVVCANVAYNVPDLGPFVAALTAHARVRVVLELTARHPLSDLNDLWRHFHGLARPTRPTAGTAAAVLREIGMQPHRRDWDAPPVPGGLFDHPEEVVAWTRRRLCLPASRDPEIAALLATQMGTPDGRYTPAPRRMVTLWWPGTAA